MSTDLGSSMPPRNATSIQPAALDDSSQFTRSNVIGTFLTLQLCQLTQPYGSLLFHGVSGFFWRCNPIASLVEAAIIFWHLGAAVFGSWRTGRAAILRQLQQTASGILLLRGAMAKDDVDGLLSKLNTENHPARSDERVPPIGSAQLREASASTTAAQPSEADINPQPVSRQPTLEANRPIPRTNTLSAFGRVSEQSHILREAFGSNALAHRELRIDLFTALTELFVFIKLVAVSGNGWFTAACLFLIAGWGAVQILLVLLHSREMDDLEMAAAVRITSSLHEELKKKSWIWTSMFLTLHLPFFGYPAYLVSFRPWFPDDASGFLGFFRVTGDLLCRILAFTTAWLGFMGGLSVLFVVLSGDRWAFKLTLPLVLLPVWFLVTAAPMSYAFQEGPPGDKRYKNAFTSFFEPHSVMYYIIDEGFTYFLDAIFFSLLLVIVVSIYYLVFYATKALSHSDKTSRARVSAGNVIFTLVVFAIFVASYDTTQTFKPWWTDLLG